VINVESRINYRDDLECAQAGKGTAAILGVSIRKHQTNSPFIAVGKVDFKDTT